MASIPDTRCGDTPSRRASSRCGTPRATRASFRSSESAAVHVARTVCRRGERLKEFVVGVEVFGKDSMFDPRNDPIVRVQARRLRAQLARYYAEGGQTDETVIELPKGG